MVNAPQCHQNCLNVCASQYVRSCSPFRALSNLADWVAIIEIMPDGVIENNAHHVADLAARCWSACHEPEPLLHFTGADARQGVFTPARYDPFPQVAVISC